MTRRGFVGSLAAAVLAPLAVLRAVKKPRELVAVDRETGISMRFVQSFKAGDVLTIGSPVQCFYGPGYVRFEEPVRISG